MAKDTFWRDFGTYSTLGIDLAAFVAGGFYLGLKLDQRFGTAPRWIMAGFLTGLGLGLYSMFALAARMGGGKAKKKPGSPGD